MALPKSLLEQVRRQAKHQCEYCHYPEILSTAPLSIDHIKPQSLGGTDNLDNLALACRRCNEKRYNFTTGIDPETGVGITAIGRATCRRLDLNDDRRSEKFIQKSRQQWIQAGLHPPKYDPQQT